MPTALIEQEFSRHLNSKFRLDIGEQRIELELIEVKPYFPQESEQRGMERFSIFFDGPNVYLPQGVYSLEHEQMGRFDLFLVPIAKNDQKFRYEAVFNYYKNRDEVKNAE